VMYVPSYDPAMVWGAAPAYYPYPPMYYPPVSTGAVVATGILSFGAGVAVGSLWGGGGWGWGCGWGGNNVTVNNNFINSNHFNRAGIANGRPWQHNTAMRGGVPYANRDVANRYGNNNFNNRNNQFNRPNASQTQQRLDQASRNAGQGRFTQGNQGIGQRNN